LPEAGALSYEIHQRRQTFDGRNLQPHIGLILFGLKSNLLPQTLGSLCAEKPRLCCTNALKYTSL